MLKSLSVSNFALIDHAHIEFAAGLNVLTGETGAGKSILIDALSTILGDRASVDSIRKNSEYFRVEAVFEMTQQSQLYPLLEEQGIPLDDNVLIINRRLTRNGKNTVVINGCQVPIAVLKQIGDQLVDMHGQHENQSLLRPESHLAMLDHFHDAIVKNLNVYQTAYRDWVQVKEELSVLMQQVKDAAQRSEMLRWQVDEISKAALKAGEDEQLDQEIRILANREKIANATMRSYTILAQGIKGTGGIIAEMSEVKRELESVSRYDPAIGDKTSVILDCLYQLEEVASGLRDYNDSMDFEPSRLNTLQERSNLIATLKRKYGASIDDILASCEQARTELAAVEDFDQRRLQLETRQRELETALSKYSAGLDELRRQAAQEMARLVTGHLTQLGMPNAVFIVQVTKQDQYTPHGQNEVRFLFSANKGEDPKPLSKVASGGELSRVALAFKAVGARRDRVGTMIFDEVDAGIGGLTAQMVGEKIALVALDKQVLCITHSAQIACMADQHIFVEKQEQTEETCTIIKILAEDEKVLELSRMTSGNNVTTVSLDNARQILDKARQKKDFLLKQAKA